MQLTKLATLKAGNSLPVPAIELTQVFVFRHYTLYLLLYLKLICNELMCEVVWERLKCNSYYMTLPILSKNHHCSHSVLQRSSSIARLTVRRYGVQSDNCTVTPDVNNDDLYSIWTMTYSRNQITRSDLHTLTKQAWSHAKHQHTCRIRLRLRLKGSLLCLSSNSKYVASSSFIFIKIIPRNHGQLARLPLIFENKSI